MVAAKPEEDVVPAPCPPSEVAPSAESVSKPSGTVVRRKVAEPTVVEAAQPEKVEAAPAPAAALPPAVVNKATGVARRVVKTGAAPPATAEPQAVPAAAETAQPAAQLQAAPRQQWAREEPAAAPVVATNASEQPAQAQGSFYGSEPVVASSLKNEPPLNMQFGNFSGIASAVPAGSILSQASRAGYGAQAQQPQPSQQPQAPPQVPPGMGLEEQARLGMSSMHMHDAPPMHDDQRMFMAPMPYMSPYGYAYTDEAYYMDQQFLQQQQGGPRGKAQTRQRSPNERAPSFAAGKLGKKEEVGVGGQPQGPLLGQLSQSGQAPQPGVGAGAAAPRGVPAPSAFKPALNKGFSAPPKKPYAPAQQAAFPQYMPSMYNPQYYPQYMPYYQSPQYPPRSNYYQAGPYQGYAYPEEYADPSAQGGGSGGGFDTWEGPQAGAPMQDNAYRGQPANAPAAGGQAYPYAYPQPQFGQPYPESWSGHGQYPPQR